MKNTVEIKKYEGLLKRNEQTIAELTQQNKHIKSHIKFLRETDEFDGTTASTFTEHETLDAHDVDEGAVI